jgi:putative 4-mercaptohistidine N1-methyltranferase
MVNWASTTNSGSVGNVYETDKAVQEYLFFHYGRPETLLPYAFGPHEALDFPVKTAKLCVEAAAALGVDCGRALDVGCSVGRTSFELSRSFGEVVGVDFSHAFVAAANSLKEGGKLDFKYTEEADIQGAGVATLPSGSRPDVITFQQGDACNLPVATLGKFNVIHGANLLCRLPDPAKFLRDCHDLLEEGGIVVLVSPYSWLEQYTDKDKWLGGRDEEGSPEWSAAGLAAVMEGKFKRLEGMERDVSFLIREHRRKYQWGCSHATFWQKL